MNKVLLAGAAAGALFAAGCVDVNVGKASKEWSDVGKKFADSIRQGPATPAPVPAAPRTPAPPAVRY